MARSSRKNKGGSLLAFFCAVSYKLIAQKEGATGVFLYIINIQEGVISFSCFGSNCCDFSHILAHILAGGRFLKIWVKMTQFQTISYIGLLKNWKNFGKMRGSCLSFL